MYLKKILYYFKNFILILFIIFEDITWNKIGLPFYNFISSFTFTDLLKEKLSKINNEYIVFIIFIIPMIIMKYIEFLSLVNFTMGNLLIAVIQYITTYIIIIPIVFIFKIKKKELIKFKIIKITYFLILKLKRIKQYKNIVKDIKKIKNKLYIKYKYLKNKNLIYYYFYFEGIKEVFNNSKKIKDFDWKKNYEYLKKELNNKNWYIKYKYKIKENIKYIKNKFKD